MDKVLFFINDWDDFLKVRPHLDKLEDSGYEVAFDTTDISVVASLAVDKRLVVRLGVYNPNFVVSDYNVAAEARITIDQFLEAAQ